MAHVTEHIAERLDHRGLTRARNACDADAQSVARPRQQALEDALRTFEVLAAVALDEGDRTRERHAVAARHTLDVVVLGEDELAMGHALPVQ